ncbi:MAG: NAD-dependent epimerase/dehydratase family protein [Bacteroidota bacterium]
MPSVFLTGASGCVGHYLVDELSPDYELHLLVRNPAKLLFDPAKLKNVHIVPGDLDSISDHAALLSRMDYCIHAATAWGGEAAERINVQKSHELFSLLNPERIRRIVYFSTASILGRGNVPISEAERYGTDYIRSKYRCYLNLPQCRLAERIVTVFPTLVFGGDMNHPYSHLSSGLKHLQRYAWMLGRLNVDVYFHFIHARDIARIVHFLIEAPRVERQYVLGNEAVTLGEFTKRAAAFFGHKIRRQVTISTRLLKGLASLFGAKISDWDRFCLAYADFRYQTTNYRTLGMSSELDTIEGILADWKRHGTGAGP